MLERFRSNRKRTVEQQQRGCGDLQWWIPAEFAKVSFEILLNVLTVSFVRIIR